MPAQSRTTSSHSQPAGHALLPVVAIAAWVLPGAGHLIMRQRGRGLIFLVAIAATFWGGVAIGGVRSTVDPAQRRAWFMAQICCGAHTLVALSWAGRYTLEPDQDSPYRAVWPADDIAVVYTGVAGLLNLLIIFDALGRFDPRAAVARTRPSPPATGGPT